MGEKVTYWIEMSDYDLETADAMFVTSRYLYVGFMCHQTIEKDIKGLLEQLFGRDTSKNPFIVEISRKTGIDQEMSEEQLDFIDRLEPLNIEARYPSYKERLMNSLSKEYCRQLLNETKELQQWIKNKL